MELKRAIRERILKQRCGMGFDEWNRKSKVISKKVIDHPWFLEASEILCYMNHRMEVDTEMMIREAFRLGKKVAIPRVQQDTMDFYYIDSLMDVKKGSFGIREPNQNHKANGKDILLIMPGVAFDQKRNRVGYGKGFYDRYCSEHSVQRIIGLAFENQMVECIPADKHDKKPDIVITEEREYE